MEFIHKFRQLTNVYVHCYAGVSRSVTIVVAYLMNCCKWNLKTALAFVQTKRIVAKPNDGFIEQLKKY
jgi:protein-tyrosine phosphatase